MSVVVVVVVVVVLTTVVVVAIVSGIRSGVPLKTEQRPKQVQQRPFQLLAVLI